MECITKDSKNLLLCCFICSDFIYKEAGFLHSIENTEKIRISKVVPVEENTAVRNITRRNLFFKFFLLVLLGFANAA